MDPSSKVPYRTVVTGGQTYWWCACGQSRKQPFCDGSHRGTTFTPIALKTDETLTVALCGCKRTANPPYCDGRHAQPDSSK